MTDKRVFVVETSTYKKSLYELKDSKTILSIEKKVNKLIDNPGLAIPMCKQHDGICEIKVGDKYRVYCIKKDNAIILFILGPAMHHKKNYENNKEYQKLFTKLKILEKEYDNMFIEELEKIKNIVT